MSHPPAAETEPEPQTTALVVLRPAAGGSLRDAEPVSVSNLERVLPDPSAAADVASRLTALGFDVGPHFGVAMSITAPTATFVDVFGSEPDGTGEFGADEEFEFDIAALDDVLTRHIEAILVEQPVHLDAGDSSAAAFDVDDEPPEASTWSF